MKRGREADVGTIISVADCLMILSHNINLESVNTDSPSRVFECKTCNRQFSSFQALGGHRASHKKQLSTVESKTNQSSPPKPKTHECAVCGLEFTIGQALGGHMRRHRLAASDGNKVDELTLFPLRGPCRKENSRDFLCLDLNLTPRQNGLKSQFKEVAPIYCFL